MGFVVALQTYVLHNWSAYGPAVACGGLSTSQNERKTVASERSLDVPSVCVRFTLARLNLDSGSSASHDE
jgi:hypothetical protein